MIIATYIEPDSDFSYSAVMYRSAFSTVWLVISDWPFVWACHAVAMRSDVSLRLKTGSQNSDRNLESRSALMATEMNHISEERPIQVVIMGRG